MKPCFLIPVYNHHLVLETILSELAQYELPCIMVDDGSDAECAAEILRVAALRDWVEADRLAVNSGKGCAVIRGLEIASQRGYTHAFQIDADGQHNLQDIPLFLQQAQAAPSTLILGQAEYDESVPVSRHYGRYITHFWVWIETLSFSVKDSMCGFRIYPVNASLESCRNKSVGMRMDFDIEIVVRLCWMGVPVLCIPTLVRYPQDGVSHFNILQDNLRISGTHTKLFFGMLVRLPLLLARKLGIARSHESTGQIR